MSESAACPACTALVAAGATFCTHCGEPVAVVEAPAAAELPAAMPAERAAPNGPRRRASTYRDRLVAEQAAQNTKHLRNAGLWILAMAAIFVLAGTFTGVMHRNEAQQVLNDLSGRNGAEVVEVAGEERTIAELRVAIRSETTRVFLVNYLLAALFLGLFFWSRKAPLPATITALCVYLAVQVLNAIVDPATIVQGLLVKALCIGSLVAGIRAALAQRPAPPAGA